jgi:glycosyltransferase involved in cell wall biosynthesis
VTSAEHRPPLRVALLTTSWPRDDADMAGRFLAGQVERVREAGVEFEVVGPASAVGPGGFRDFGIASGGGVVANAKRRPWLLPLLLVNIVRALRRAARGADVVHANWLLTAPLAAMGGKPVVLTLHGSGSAGRFDDLGLAEHHPRLFRWLISKATVVTAVSKPLADAARAAGATRVVELPHGVDVPAEPVAASRMRARVNDTDDGSECVVLFAGRLSAEKGVDTLAAAWPLVRSARLVVAGDGPERGLLEALDVTPLGFLPHAQLLELYPTADVLVMPSHSEGFGVTALEALAHGVPVVASRVGGLAGLVEHEVTGLHVPAGDAEALAAALQRLVDDVNLRESLGDAAQRAARERYSWQHVSQLWRDAYAAASLA